MFANRIFSNKFDLFWTTTVFLYLVQNTQMNESDTDNDILNIAKS